MRLAFLLLVGAPVVVAPACGGPSFTPASTDGGSEGGSSSSSGSSSSGGTGDAASDAKPAPEAGPMGTYCGPNLVCSGTGMQQGTVCCVSSGTPPAYACAGATCGCATQLDCASDADCSGGLRCCMRTESGAACTSGHEIARCSADCIGGTHMCAPGAGPGQCLPTQQCSMDTGSVGLPSQSGFGICM